MIHVGLYIYISAGRQALFSLTLKWLAIRRLVQHAQPWGDEQRVLHTPFGLPRRRARTPGGEVPPGSSGASAAGGGGGGAPDGRS